MDTIRFASEQLEIEVAQPGTVYRGTRFDWSGFVTQVALTAADGSRHTYCMPESLVEGQGTGGIGLCNEFGYDLPIGFDDAQPGEPFTKLGVGLLRRPDTAGYNFFRAYEIAQPAVIRVEAAPQQAVFVVEPLPCAGYAARLTKTLAAFGSELKITYLLENVGEKPLVTNEYLHNFMGFDAQPIGPNYRLSFPYPVVLEELPGMPAMLTEDLVVQGNSIGLRSEPKHPFYARLLGASLTSVLQWSLEHTPGALCMSETNDFAPVRVAIWGTGHVMSAEVFAGIEIAPGASQTWSRHYRFSAG